MFDIRRKHLTIMQYCWKWR